MINILEAAAGLVGLVAFSLIPVAPRGSVAANPLEVGSDGTTPIVMKAGQREYVHMLQGVSNWNVAEQTLDSAVPLSRVRDTGYEYPAALHKNLEYGSFIVDKIQGPANWAVGIVGNEVVRMVDNKPQPGEATTYLHGATVGYASQFGLTYAIDAPKFGSAGSV